MLNCTASDVLPRATAQAYYARVRDSGPSFLMASEGPVAPTRRLSLVGFAPSVAFQGTANHVEVRLLQPRGRPVLDLLREAFAAHHLHEELGVLTIFFDDQPFSGPEHSRFERPVPGRVLRVVLQAFAAQTPGYAGLYGALGYHFINQYEDLQRSNPSELPDFHFFLYDNLLRVNHLTEEVQLFCTRSTTEAAQAALSECKALFELDAMPEVGFSVANVVVSPSAAEFEANVREVIRLCEMGEVMEVVLARSYTADFLGDPFALYTAYAAHNPAPYLFYFDLADEVLLGASPELMLRCERGRLTLRPISGSTARGASAVDEHHLDLALLNSKKEKAELDMLVDLGRNDLARVCRPGVEVTAYRVLEKYKRVTHTVAQVEGDLDTDRFTGFDALVASLNAGTLTGAPKLAAMQFIETLETQPRGYYGGAVGGLLFNGDVNTGITIRSAHIRNGRLQYLSGATLLVDSDPVAERRETELKAQAFLDVLHPKPLNDA